MEEIRIDLLDLYSKDGTAKLDGLPAYLDVAQRIAGAGNCIVLTGRAPIWLYLAVAHALHGTARSLTYDSPVTGPVVIFDHDPF